MLCNIAKRKDHDLLSTSARYDATNDPGKEQIIRAFHSDAFEGSSNSFIREWYMENCFTANEIVSFILAMSQG